MKKIMDNILFVIGLVSIALILLFATNAFAGETGYGFNYGTDTYEKVDDILIVNSLGDQTTVSSFGKLGTNDWIPENGVKNYLALEGYTIANDFNPSVTNPQFPEYGVKPEEDMTKLTFAGLLGDPRTTQDVYVLTKEYNRLSAQGQAESIDNLNNGLSNETINRINGDNTLQTNINSVDTNSKGRDTVLQNNIDTESNTRSSADSVLQSNISNVDSKQTTWNNQQDASINNLNNAVDNLDNRLGKLEQTQYVAEAEFRVFDSKRLTIKPFIRQNFTRSKLDTVGVRFTIKFGESYEEKEIAKTNARVDNINSRLASLEKRLGQPAYIEKTIIKDTKGKTTKTSIHITDVPAVLSVRGEF